MKQKLMRAIVALVLIGAAGAAGYMLAGGGHPSLRSGSAACVAVPPATVATPAAGSMRVLYSLDQKQNDKELIALIDAAKAKAYFAIYEFTLKDVADALVAAKRRGVDVRGLVDAGESASSYDQPIIKELVAAGIPVEAEKHPDGNGIMHIKLLVTDQAYALGSYNWTGSATTENDEILEIGTDPTLRQTYENLLTRLFAAYAGTTAAAHAAATSIGTIDYTQAADHIGDTASVRGTLVDAYASKSGTVFLDFCQSYKACPFSGVIFADDASAFGDLSRDAGHLVTLTGKITSYQGQAEMILSDPSQLATH
jgi:hypothetical protein